VIIELNPLKWEIFNRAPSPKDVEHLPAAQPLPVVKEAQHTAATTVSAAIETPAKAEEKSMSFESVVLTGVKDVEVGIADAVKIFSTAAAKAPAGVTALTALAGAVDKALADVAADAGNPSALVITLPATVGDFKTVWADGKALLASVGVK
jgi:hypothetical protein